MVKNLRNIVKDSIRNYAINAVGWRTNRKIIVFESDDWGSVRMKSKESYNYFLNKGFRVNLCPYNTYDSLESNDDLELLFDVLSSIKDSNGNPAIITANNIVANPDFERIKSAEYQEYYFESFVKTLERYPHRNRVMNLYKEGMSNKLIRPQFHGREHVNVNRWMTDLKQKRKETLTAFEQDMFSVRVTEKSNSTDQYLESFGKDYSKEKIFETHHNIVTQGVTLFKEIWKFSPLSFIAPCYTWSSLLESSLNSVGIKYIQGVYVQKSLPKILDHGYDIIRHYQGQVNGSKQRYLIRNVFFEPAENPNLDWINSAMNEIQIAFRFKKPAIISSHRVNFSGSIFPENRDRNLMMLRLLLQSIMKKWPEVEFMTTDQVGQLMDTAN
jgi:hypothetical protein